MTEGRAVSRSTGAHPAALLLVLLLVLLDACGAAPQRDGGEVADRVAVRIVTDEADAAVAILRSRASGEEPDEAIWRRLFESEGFRRLGQRETALGRRFGEDEFRTYLGQDSLLPYADRLADAVREWQRVDLGGAARLALAYLPDDARIAASLYPVIKPRSNSFVFATGTDSAAIFMYLHTGMAARKLENTLAHELHHIGYAAACTTDAQGEHDALREALRWTGAFGEGIAMLAAAGGPEIHPHAVSDSVERATWDANLRNAPQDLQELEELFGDILEERITGDSIVVRAMTFFGEQGPWYTVGWLMASTVERELGRRTLVEGLCRPGRLLVDYNAAAAATTARTGTAMPLWSDVLISRLRQ